MTAYERVKRLLLHLLRHQIYRDWGCLLCNRSAEDYRARHSIQRW